VTATEHLPSVVGTVRVTVAVPTFHRADQLRALLPLVLEQTRELTAGGRYAADVLVVDNDPERSAAGVVAALGTPDVRYVCEPTPGIAAVRNRALDEAEGSLLVYIDDDERPEPRWLAEIVGTWAATGATAVAGRARVEHAPDLDPWIVAGGFFDRRSIPTGTPIEVAATYNLLLDVPRVRASGVRFDTSLGLTSGEDTLFTRSLSRAGEPMVFCNESVVVDPVPAVRQTRSWVLVRQWSHGTATVAGELRLTTGRLGRLLVRVRCGVGGVLRAGAGGARWGCGVLTGSLHHQARGLRLLYRGVGMACGACGVTYAAYGRPGRRRRWSR
jgi:succinoglycan biosynthesis protein ExoM